MDEHTRAERALAIEKFCEILEEKEILITDAMVKAGAIEYRYGGVDIDIDNYRARALSIFIAMVGASDDLSLINCPYWRQNG